MGFFLHVFETTFHDLEQKLGGGATGQAKKGRRRPDPNLDDYTSNSSENQYRFKNQPQNMIRA
jgi:hypothetical protein